MTEFHPIADVFPLMEGEEFAELVQSIKENGLRDAIVTFNELILDGRNRYRACQAAGVEPMMEDYTGDDPLGYVIDKNMRRRHMEIGQRAMVAAEIAKLTKGRRFNDSPDSSRAEAAKMMHVSIGSVGRAKEVLRDGTAEEIASVKSGERTVGEVANNIKQARELRKSVDIVELAIRRTCEYVKEHDRGMTASQKREFHAKVIERLQPLSTTARKTLGIAVD